MSCYSYILWSETDNSTSLPGCSVEEEQQGEAGEVGRDDSQLYDSEDPFTSHYYENVDIILIDEDYFGEEEEEEEENG